MDLLSAVIFCTEIAVGFAAYKNCMVNTACLFPQGHLLACILHRFSGSQMLLQHHSWILELLTLSGPPFHSYTLLAILDLSEIFRITLFGIASPFFMVMILLIHLSTWS